MIIGEDLLARTKERYDSRTKEREEVKEKLRRGKVLACDTPERVRKRISRLSSHARFSETRLQRELASAPENADQLLNLIRDLALERVMGKNDMMPIHFLELGVRIARTVCRIHVRSMSRTLVGYGTGFLVSPNLLLTNNHVLADEDMAAFSRCEFDFQETAEGERSGSVFFDLDARRFFLTDKERDYTLVAVKPVGTGGVDLNRFGWNKLIGEEGKAIIGEYVSIIQHPNGNPKHVALRENRIVDIPNDLFLHYETDTAPGSSGSPVFNDQWEVVALHHSGVVDRNEAGDILALDGSVWNASMGETQIKWKANEGARISRILAHVQQADFRGFKGGLVEELLQGPPPAAFPREGWNSLVPASSAGTAAAGTITIPIHLTLALGAAGTGGFGAPAAPAIPASGPASPSFSNRKDLDEALKELERAKKSIYYDASKDEADKATYYDDFEPDDSMSNNFRGLNRLTKTRHTKVFKYKPALHLYPWVDLQPDLQLKSIYSGKEFDAEELIREDFRIEAEREARMHELLSRETSLSEEQLRMELDALEAQSPFNCEHVVPQSYFNKREPMRGDLHHLFACASDCNSFRGNTPYFQFAQEEEVVRHDCGRREQNMFEPQSGKGPVARATLYFLLRYPSLIDDSRKEYEKERLGILLGWHRENPVTDYERHRNQAIFQMQGNRNPLIDHPEWWEGIDFSLGLG